MMKINGSDKNDILKKFTAQSITIEAGKGADMICLYEAIPASDTVIIKAGDSPITGFDIINGFSTANIKDRLDLPTNLIAKDGNTNGINVGIFKSHHIFQGVITLYGNDTSTGNATVITTDNLTQAESYLQANITNGQTVSLTQGKDTYVFQDGGANANDTLIEMEGINNGGLTIIGTPDLIHAIWLI